MSTFRRLRQRAERAVEEKGAALPFIAMLLVLLIGIAAFAIDLGWLYLNGARLQRAADSAALAGVVYLPTDTSGAADRAVDGADANGWDVGSVNGNPIAGGGADSLNWSQLADNKMEVTLEASVPTFFVKILGFDQFTIRRTATAEYIKPVPIGSPYDYFGTGSNNFWASINGKWTAHMQGDPYNTRCDWTRGSGNDPDDFSDSNCVDSSNTNYNNYFSGNGYSPSNGDIDSDNDQYNPEYDGRGYYYGVELTSTGNGTVTVQLYDPRFRRSSSGSCSSTTGDCDLLTFSPSISGGYSNVIGPTTRYRLYAPDNTPLDPTDNTDLVSGCDNTYSPTTSSSASGVNQWVSLCSLTNPTEGIYVLRVTADNGVGSNEYGIRTSISGNYTAKIYGINNVSIYTNQGGSTATMYLAEVNPIHAGKTLQISFYDAGEDDGSASYTIKQPDGSTATCEWASDDGQSGGPGSCVIQTTERISHSWEPRFNAQWLTVQVDIPDDYACDISSQLGCWWKVSIVNNQPHDRTTWAAEIVGNPVRLVPNE